MVFTSFVKERQVDTPISGSVLSIQAQKFPNDLHVDKTSRYDASKGWLLRFEHRSKELKTNQKVTNVFKTGMLEHNVE